MIPGRSPNSFWSVAIPASLSPVPLVATCCGQAQATAGREEYLCRIGYADKRGFGTVDMYYPYADAGMLWFRHEGGCWCVSGMLKHKLFPSAASANELVSSLSGTFGIDDQLAVCVELVDVLRCVIESGEESLFFESDGESGARFSSQPASELVPASVLWPIGLIRPGSEDVPGQGNDDAPDAWLELSMRSAQGLRGLEVGQEVVLITGPQQARSPDRPNPLGLHHVRILEIQIPRLRVGPLDAIDGTPLIDIKPA